MRIALAILASVLSVAIVSGSALSLAILKFGDDGGVGIAIAIVMAYSLSAAIGVIFVGLPMHYWMIKKRRRSSIPYLLVGAIIPGIIVFLLHPFGDSPLRQLVMQALISGFLGSICALVFWVIATRLRGNNAKNPI